LATTLMSLNMTIYQTDMLSALSMLLGLFTNVSSTVMFRWRSTSPREAHPPKAD
jgi:hypothetical protein